MPGVETVAGTILVALRVGLFLAGGAMARQPGRWNRYLAESFWIRAILWVAVLAAAAVIGSLAAGGGQLTPGLIVFTLVALGVIVLFWANAKAFGPRD